MYELKKNMCKSPDTQWKFYIVIIITVIIAFSYFNSVTIFSSDILPSLPPRLYYVLEHSSGGD